MRITLVALGLLLIPLYLLLVYPAEEGPDIARFLLVSQIIFFAYLVIIFIYRRLSVDGASSRNLWSFMIAVAVVVRVIVVVGSAEQTYLSDDVYRYVWEGKIISNGYNPYLLSPEDMEDSGLADTTIHPRINHAWLPTIYPPLSQYLFATAYLIGGDSVWGFKLISLLFELLAALAVYGLVRTAHLPPWTFMIYLLSPLVIIEFLMSNHLDIFALPFLAVMLSYLVRQRPMPVTVGTLLALVTLVKLYGLFFLPVLLIHFPGKDKIRFLLSFALVVSVFYLPFLVTSGRELFGSLWIYLGTWQYNGSVFQLARTFLGENVARIACAVIFVGAAGLASLSRRKARDPIHRMFLIFGDYVMLTPALFPWYLVWTVPFIVLYRNLAFLILSGTVFLSYHVLIGYHQTGVWVEYPLLRIAEYVPFYGLLVYQFFARRKASRESAI
ncbi:MAG: hypothetical protein JSU74_00230 [Candidatus Zixiibacteriota bacterium]|nr:MAG: hypothetical protein JSU74_00230 [candidate division Zixibacteria bacterium]